MNIAIIGSGMDTSSKHIKERLKMLQSYTDTLLYKDKEAIEEAPLDVNIKGRRPKWLK